MKTIPQRLVLLLFASVAVSLLGAGCSTIRGVGRDVEKTGEGIQHAATH